MAKQLTIVGNYMLVTDDVTGKVLEFPIDKVRYEDEGLYILLSILGERPKYTRIDVADISGFADKNALLLWLRTNTGGAAVVGAASPAISEQRAANLHVTLTAAVNVGATATLPAAAAGLFHYITSIELSKMYVVIGVASGAGVIATSTNLPGTPAWTTPQAAGAVGTVVKVIDYTPTTPLKASVAATATTFVAPAQLETIWRWNISYFTAV